MQTVYYPKPKSTFNLRTNVSMVGLLFVSLAAPLPGAAPEAAAARTAVATAAVAAPAPAPPTPTPQPAPEAPRATTPAPHLPEVADTPPALAPRVGTPPARPNHFIRGYCTWWVASKRDVPWYGDAGAWYRAAQASGFAVGPLPKVGSIYVSWENRYYGHVAYVESVSGDTFTVSEMNYHGYGNVDTRTIRLGTTPLVGFIYDRS